MQRTQRKHKDTKNNLNYKLGESSRIIFRVISVNSYD